jgi:hypothetical protein
MALRAPLALANGMNTERFDKAVIFLGPTCPVEDARAILPDALVVPPVNRGDLYRYRVLKYSLLVIVDGVFADAPSVSPREVVDVLRDGALVIGVSSMGALRAADCAPAGAVGLGEIYRLYHRRIISSEDEVAVVFRTDQPFPPLTESLVNMRIALRRATRTRLLTSSQADLIVTTAGSMHYSERTWANSFAHAGIPLRASLSDFLRTVDTKRADARVAFRWIADRLRRRLPLGSPRIVPNVFDLFKPGRERPPNPLDGSECAESLGAFVEWLAVSGQMYKLQLRNPESLICPADGDDQQIYSATDGASDVWRSAELDAILMRFSVHRRAEVEAHRRNLQPGRRDLALAELEICDAHDAPSWVGLMERYQTCLPFRRRLKRYRDGLASTKTLKQYLFAAGLLNSSNPEGILSWRRT